MANLKAPLSLPEACHMLYFCSLIIVQQITKRIYMNSLLVARGVFLHAIFPHLSAILGHWRSTSLTQGLPYST